ncbi:hypothetical protein N7454_005024 [Penicillium verhagenii]|nr:hypothetical protein N7454_005024 [Penicillium verhagenii]
MDPESTRVAIYATVTDIEGCPQQRHIQIGEQFCKYINREFHPLLDPVLYDHVHIPADFDSPKPLRRWFILDLNVTQALDNKDVRKLPHQVYLATQRDDKLDFILRDQWVEKAKERALTYIWGGRQEQDIVENMRKGIDVNC